MSWVQRQSGRTNAWRPMVFLALVGILACGDQTGPVEPTSARVTGRVVDSNTLLPIAAAQVSIGDITITTDASGRFELVGVPSGPVMLRCVATGFAESHVALAVLGDGADIEVRLDPIFGRPAKVGGVVVVASTGAPVAGAQVGIAGSSTSTTADGHFELDGLVSGPAVVRVGATGFEDHESDVMLYPGAGTANIALRSITDPGVTFDLTAQIQGFDPAWGDQTGGFYRAVLTLPNDYRTTGAFGGTLSDWRYIGGDETLDVGTWRIAGSVLSGGGVVMEADRLLWTMSARIGTSGNLVGSWGCCGHISGSFTATVRPPS